MERPYIYRKERAGKKKKKLIFSSRAETCKSGNSSNRGGGPRKAILGEKIKESGVDPYLPLEERKVPKGRKQTFTNVVG